MECWRSWSWPLRDDVLDLRVGGQGAGWKLNMVIISSTSSRDKQLWNEFWFCPE